MLRPPRGLAARPVRALGLRARILGAFLLSFSFFLGATALSLFQLDRLGDVLAVIDDGYVPLSRTAAQLDGAVIRVESDLDRIHRDEPRRLAGQRSNAELYSGIIDAYVTEGIEAIDAVRPQVRDPDEGLRLDGLKTRLETVREHNVTLNDTTHAYLDLAEAGQSVEAKAMQPELFSAKDALKTEVDAFSSEVDGRIRRLSAGAAESQSLSLILSGAFALAALGAGVAMLALAVVSLRPIGQMTAEVGRLAGGQYDARIRHESRDELGVLAHAINDMASAIEHRDEELRRSAEEKARAERLALVGQMLAQITHEVRNPLNAMSLNAELLQDELDALPEDRRAEATEILATVTSEMARLEHTTEHYLAMARRPNPTPEPVFPHLLLISVGRLLEEPLRRSGTALRLDAKDIGEVTADPAQMRQALLNVVRNAAEAGAKTIDVALNRDGAAWSIRVQDDGPGLSDEEAERIFDPFFTTKATGSGLGLAITRQIVDDHGGSIAFQPCPVGARLLLRFPV